MKSDNKIKEIIRKHRVIVYILLFLMGLFLGYLIFAPSKSKSKDAKEQSSQQYTCSMHPQIRQDKPGKCPLCGMDLTPLGQTSSEDLDPNSVMFTDEAVALADIETIVLWKEDSQKELTLYGNVDINERNSQIQSSYVNGRVEKLFINAVGDKVSKGQTIALIYSPEVYAVSQELVAALNYADKNQSLAIVNAAKEKLLLWNITQSQIDNIIKNRKVSDYIEIKSNTNGTVVKKNISQGDYIEQGEELFTIANLSNLWVQLKAYEQDIPFLRVGQRVEITLEALANKKIESKISFISPLTDEKTRTTDIRVEIPNPKGKIRPQMYVTAKVVADMSEFKDKLLVPKSAVLFTGKRSIVYVKDPNQTQPTFTFREIELGNRVGDYYIVLSGLEEGEEIASNGVFQIDAAAQLEGKRSMMNE
ncbi:MAG: efflux RND transporter periplasmic adaptor subunit [Bacteroidota bacterium]|nr:efflux RND transporter periplasmic adaptor subunit [Bacteroidota bacterium]